MCLTLLDTHLYRICRKLHKYPDNTIWGFYIQIEEKDHFLNLKASECDGSPRKDQGATKKCDYTPRHDQPIFSQVNRIVDFLSNVVSIPVLDWELQFCFLIYYVCIMLQESN